MLKVLSVGVVYIVSQGTGLPWFGHQIMELKGPIRKACVHQDLKGSYSFTILFFS